MSDSDSDHDLRDKDGPRPSKRPRTSLFIADSDDEGDNDGTGTIANAKTPASDINAIFDDAENDETLAYTPLAPPLDLDALRREADARNAKNIQPMAHTSSPPRDKQTGASRKESGGREAEVTAARNETTEGRKQRRKIFKLDETSLLGPNGFPQLVKDTHNFKPKGKGHEASDLNRLLQIYQFWAHRLNPKAQFRDTVERVEKLCHLRRMHVALSVWRDEARGRDDEPAIDISSDEENQNDPKPIENVQEINNNASSHTSSPSQTSSRAASPSTSPPAHTRPPSSASGHISPDDDFDIDAFIREEGDHAMTQSLPGSRATTTHGKPKDGSFEPTDEEEAMWDELMPLPLSVSDKSKVLPPERLFDDDGDEMWGVASEMANDPQPRPPISSVEPSGPDDEDDFDSMYL